MKTHHWRWLTITPAMVWLFLFLILPGLLILAASFATRGDYGEVIWSFSTENYTRAAGFGILGWSPDTLWALLRSTLVAAVTSLLSVLLAYPLAFFIAAQPKRKRYFWLTLVIVPFWTNLVIRTYAWMLLLSPELPLAKWSAQMGWIAPGSSLYPSGFAVYIGMLSAFLPFVVLPLYSSIERLSTELIEATQDLYASPWRTFFQGIFPQTVPGLTAAVILTFVPAMGMFVIPDLLGGGRYLMIGNLIQQEFGSSRDWPYGAALSLVLIVLTLIGLRLYRTYARGVDLV